MLNCSLHKPESTFDQIRKSYPNLIPTDAALLSNALVLSGRRALVHYDQNIYQWPDDYQLLTTEICKEIRIINQANTDPTEKKVSKVIVSEEETEIVLSLVPNFKVGENYLGERSELKKIFADLLQVGVEFSYSPVDIGWQLAVNGANWNVISQENHLKKIKFKTKFEGNCIGMEIGSNTGSKKKVKTTSKAE